jgi:hypothetical protein
LDRQAPRGIGVTPELQVLSGPRVLSVPKAIAVFREPRGTWVLRVSLARKAR